MTAVDTSVERLLAKTIAERDRARDLAARLEQIATERERLLWLAIGEDTSHGSQMRAGREIARHLRETSFIPGMLEAGLRVSALDGPVAS